MSVSAIHPGDLYEDCSFHPCICMGSTAVEVWGVSLIDGSYPRSCDIGLCGVRKITPEEAWQIKQSGPIDAEARNSIPISQKWWT
jgi:hypothetical protein